MLFQEQYDIFEKHFVKFDDEFEYGSQLPEIFLRCVSQRDKFFINSKYFSDIVH